MHCNTPALSADCCFAQYIYLAKHPVDLSMHTASFEPIEKPEFMNNV